MQGTYPCTAYFTAIVPIFVTPNKFRIMRFELTHIVFIAFRKDLNYAEGTTKKKDGK